MNELIPVDQEPTVEDQEMFDAMKAQAEKQAKKELSKQAPEIKRLNKLAEAALLENNEASYVYALEKLRKIYHMESTPELLHELWVSSRKAIWEIIRAGQYQEQLAAQK